MRSTILILPPEIMEDIFLRLDAAVDVIRAAAACTVHRSIVRNPRFLRRYRLRHPPPVLGFLESMGNGGILQAQTPHQSAPAASCLLQTADFTFSFLPVDPNNTFPWRICDARDGRVLLSRRSADETATFLDLVICDPLHRRYVKIPSIPEDLWDKRYSTKMDSEPFLLPAREEEEDSRFRVIYNWVCTYKIITFLFDSKISAGTEEWSVATTFSFLPDRQIHDPMTLVRHRHYVGSRFYWVNRSVNHMLVLNLVDMRFSITGLPSGTDMEWAKVQAVVDAGVNRLGMAVLGPAAPARHLDIFIKTWQDNGGSTEEWQHHKHHQLPEGYTHHYISAAAEDYLLLAGNCNKETVHYSILDLKTFQVESFCKSRNKVYQALPYARFPPSLLSPPSI